MKTMLFETGQLDQFEDQDGTIRRSFIESDFVMLACATNPFKCLVSGNNISWIADRYFPSSESLLVFMDCSGAADGWDLAGAPS
jgi:hypothetical protein